MAIDQVTPELRPPKAGLATTEVTEVRRVCGVRRTPARWVRQGGLSKLLFLMPLLFVFGVFSWYPIVRLVTMALQHTNLVQPAIWVGLSNFSKVVHDPLFPIAVKNTAEFAALALVFGYPVPLIMAVLV
ncbi:MAG TPA: hypothetical protein VKT78_16410, partial [Fimbriimonadaceae bacterium]|nr:hypothetical protein [Fimbriimonadaceae bacterium]